MTHTWIYNAPMGVWKNPTLNNLYREGARWRSDAIPDHTFGTRFIVRPADHGGLGSRDWFNPNSVLCREIVAQLAQAVRDGKSRMNCELYLLVPRDFGKTIEVSWYELGS